ncbi:MAG: hypothetical protein J6M38_12420, partial [Lentisphaeria bacterium]|nr:hypothetical protein [Lentisphaeria bacterium]
IARFQDIPCIAAKDMHLPLEHIFKRKKFLPVSALKKILVQDASAHVTAMKRLLQQERMIA